MSPPSFLILKWYIGAHVALDQETLIKNWDELEVLLVGTTEMKVDLTGNVSNSKWQ